MLDTDELLNELNAINKKRDGGEISTDEVEKRKFKLVRGMDSSGDKEIYFDNSCTT